MNFKQLAAQLILGVVLSAGAAGQQSAASPAGTRGAATPAAPQAKAKATFEVALVNPAAGKTRGLEVENLGRKSTVRVGDPVITGVHLRDASAGSERMKVTSGAKPETRAVPVIRFRFNKDGTKALAAATRANVGQLLAVIVDGKIIAMPKVNEPVTGSEWTISGNFTADAAKSLVAQINAAR